MNSLKPINFFQLSILLVLILISSCRNKKPDDITFMLVETSDVHGAVFSWDFIRNQKSEGSLSTVHAYVKELRKDNQVILMDNGDILQGQPVVYYYNYENTADKHIVSNVMNYMDYDVATIGNHDIEAGHAVYDKLDKEFNFPWLAANAIDTKTGKPYFEPYTVIKKDGFTIAVLGLITPGIPNWLPEELWAGIEFEDMIISAKKWVPTILEKENPDLMVGLFHSGYNYEYGNQDAGTYKNENASVLVAQQVPGFDIVFIGHDHETRHEYVEDRNGDRVLILGPSGSARQITTAKVEFTKADDGTYEKEITGEVINMVDLPSDSLFDNEFKAEFNEVNNYVSKEVGVFEDEIDAHNALYGPSKFMRLIHDVQLNKSNADISFAAPLSFNAVINKGPVYVRDMFKLYRFENFLYTVELTGQEIDQYLEYSFSNWFNTMENENDHLLRFRKDKNGELIFSERYQSYQLENSYYNFDAASGIKYKVDVSKPLNQKVEIISLSNNEKFHFDSTYTVALNSYRGNGGGGHLIQGAGLHKSELTERRLSSTQKDFRYYLMKYIEEKERIDPEIENEWEVYPKDWWVKAKQKDRKLLNNN